MPNSDKGCLAVKQFNKEKKADAMMFILTFKDAVFVLVPWN